MGAKEMLVAQLLNAGGFIDGIDFHEFAPGFRGLIATKDFEQDDLLLFIPW